MATSITDGFKIDKSKFDKSGALDTILDVDSRFFLDPKLLETCKEPELKNSYSKLEANFKAIFKLLSKSTRLGDPFWKEAYKRLPSGELKGLNLGYADGTDGTGFGPTHKRQVLDTARAVVEAGIEDPVFFELVGVFEKGIGPDRISDLVCQIIKDDIIAYSERVFNELGMAHSVRYRRVELKVPENPFKHEPVLLLPSHVLRDLPIANSWEEIDAVCAHNEALRAEVNKLIGDTWKKAANDKDVLKRVLLSKPETLKDMIGVYKNKSPVEYSFEDDPSGEIIWYEIAKKASTEHPITLNSKPESKDELVSLVRQIISQFKKLIEVHSLYEDLYRDNKCTKPKPERAAQKLFFAVADSYCKANNVDISPETNSGRGSVDFKFSIGYEMRVIVETKLSSNNLLHGFETQIDEYRKSEGIDPEYSFYLPIGINKYWKPRIKEVEELRKEMIKEGKKVAEIVSVDATYKAPASHYNK